MNILTTTNKSLKPMNIRNNSGIAIILFTITLPVLIGFMGLVVDTASVYSYSSKIKSATDFACLAGVSQLTSVSNVTTAKTTALSYLNSNLTMTLPNFSALTLASPGLTIEGGAYDSTTNTWTFDESTSACNAIMVTYTYSPSTILGGYFMINSYSFSGSSIAAKTYAGSAPAGTSFPIALDISALTSAYGSSNMVRIYQNGMSQNSYLVDYEGMAQIMDVEDEISYLKNIAGTSPPALEIGDTFGQLNGGGAIGNVYSNELSSWIPGSTPFIFPIATDVGMNNVTITAFSRGTIDTVGIGGMSNYIDITLLPSTFDNTWGGLLVGADPSGFGTNEKSLLAVGAALVN